MQSVTLQVADEVAAVGTALAALGAQIKAKGTVIQDVIAFVTPLVTAVATLQNLSTDIKTADNQAYLLDCVLHMFEK